MDNKKEIMFTNFNILSSKRVKSSFSFISNEFLSFLFIVYCLANIYQLITDNNWCYYILSFIIGAIGWYRFILRKGSKKKGIAIYIAIFILSGIVNILLRINMSLVFLFTEVALFGVFLFLMKSDIQMKHISFLQYLTFVIFTLYMILGYDPNKIMTTSQNIVSYIILLHVCIYYLFKEKSNSAVSVYPAVYNFILAIYAKGRSGIICALALLVAICYIVMRSEKHFSITVFIVFTTISVSIVILFIFRSFLLEIISNTTFGVKGLDNSARLTRWIGYIEGSRTSLIKILFGNDLYSVPLIAFSNGNAHNSYVQLHAYHGLFALLLHFGLLIKALALCVKRKQSIHFIVLAIISIRAFADNILFFQVAYPIVLYVIFSTISSENTAF